MHVVDGKRVIGLCWHGRARFKFLSPTSIFCYKVSRNCINYKFITFNFEIESQCMFFKGLFTTFVSNLTICLKLCFQYFTDSALDCARRIVESVNNMELRWYTALATIVTAYISCKTFFIEFSNIRILLHTQMLLKTKIHYKFLKLLFCWFQYSSYARKW